MIGAVLARRWRTRERHHSRHHWKMEPTAAACWWFASSESPKRPCPRNASLSGCQDEATPSLVPPLMLTTSSALPEEEHEVRRRELREAQDRGSRRDCVGLPCRNLLQDRCEICSRMRAAHHSCSSPNVCTDLPWRGPLMVRGIGHSAGLARSNLPSTPRRRLHLISLPLGIPTRRDCASALHHPCKSHDIPCRRADELQGLFVARQRLPRTTNRLPTTLRRAHSESTTSTWRATCESDEHRRSACGAQVMREGSDNNHMCSFNVFTLRLFTALRFLRFFTNTTTTTTTVIFKSNPPRSTAVKDTQGKFAYERNRTSRWHYLGRKQN